MELNIWISDKVKLDKQTKSVLIEYLQGIANRIAQGHCRYGHPKKEKKYMTRLNMEFKQYKKKGNKEQILNLAVYGCLEICAPENPKFHYDPTVDSVTRGKM